MYSIKKETLTEIADAVRAMTGSTEPIAVTDIAKKILSIEGSGGSGGLVFAHTGTCGDDVTWGLTSDGLLQISGTGAMTDYTSAGDTMAPWMEHKDTITTLVIKEGVTTIGHHAFRTIPNMTSVTLPASLTKFGASSFFESTAVTKVEYAGGLDQWLAISRSDATHAPTQGGADLYLHGELLTECTIAISIIPKGVFWGVRSLTNVTIASTVTAIRDRAFGDSGLTSATFEDTVGWRWYSYEGSSNYTSPNASELTAYNLTTGKKTSYWVNYS